MSVHCDRCGRECPPFNQALVEGWLMSGKKSVSGIPYDIICPKCLELLPRPTNNLMEKLLKRYKVGSRTFKHSMQVWR